MRYIYAGVLGLAAVMLVPVMQQPALGVKNDGLVVGRIKPLDTSVRGRLDYMRLSGLQQVMPVLPVPDGFNAMPYVEQTEWAVKFMRSPEAKKIDRSTVPRERYPLTVGADGSFSVGKLPAGLYELSIRVVGEDGDEVAEGNKMLQIKAAGERVDVGEMTLTTLFNLTVGRPVPDFAVQTLDAKPLKLSDYHGKLVLLDFWATWCGPCIGETPDLKATFDAYGKDSRFVLIGLSLDNKPAPVLAYVEKNGLGWLQGHLGEWSSTEVPQQFGVRSIPSYFLVGPDGTLLAKNFRGRQIKSTVEAALQKLKTLPS